MQFSVDISDECTIYVCVEVRWTLIIRWERPLTRPTLNVRRRSPLERRFHHTGFLVWRWTTTLAVRVFFSVYFVQLSLLLNTWCTVIVLLHTCVIIYIITIASVILSSLDIQCDSMTWKRMWKIMGLSEVGTWICMFIKNMKKAVEFQMENAIKAVFVL